jgi:carbamoyl-phosphate synthase large subunit
MSKLTGVDWYMGPEMKSTGEVMGVDHDFPSALAKALTAADLTVKPGGVVLLSIADKDKAESTTLIRELLQAGFKLYATEGTAAMIGAMNAPVTMITKKLSEGHPNVVDVINEGLVHGVVNTVSQATSVMRDGFYIRRAAVERRIPCFTSLDTARAAVESLLFGPGPLQQNQGRPYSIKRSEEYLDGP